MRKWLRGWLTKRFDLMHGPTVRYIQKTMQKRIDSQKEEIEEEKKIALEQCSARLDLEEAVLDFEQQTEQLNKENQHLRDRLAVQDWLRPKKIYLVSAFIGKNHSMSVYYDKHTAQLMADTFNEMVDCANYEVTVLQIS